MYLFIEFSYNLLFNFIILSVFAIHSVFIVSYLEVLVVFFLLGMWVVGTGPYINKSLHFATLPLPMNYSHVNFGSNLPFL